MREPPFPAAYRPRTNEALPSRVVIRSVCPEVAGGRFPAKSTLGETVVVEADIFADGHDLLAAWLLHRDAGGTWLRVPMELLGNDHWRGQFVVEALGRHEYTIEAAIDQIGTWHRDLLKRIEAGQNVAVDLKTGADLLREADEHAPDEERAALLDLAEALEDPQRGVRVSAQIDEAVLLAACSALTSGSQTRYSRVLTLLVEAPLARFSTWYEMFPRSAAAEPGRHGTFRDVTLRLPYVADMGFDVLYLPPIHPIGRTHRKGKNGAPVAELEDPGSPWAIGSEAGGHTAINPDLGTLAEFRDLLAQARARGIEVALDIAFQCSPDHPWVREHPEWFRTRPDGSIQYAENPPKKYEDIYSFDFHTLQWRDLWNALRDVFLFWAEQGVRVFRVDNPHTKPFAFWERVLAEVKAPYPEAIFLSEAFTRPRIMERLSQLGFTQSYTYFAWRNTKREITEYFEELTQTEVRDYLRPSLWPNTPDILTEYLQSGGRPAFAARLILAATLGANYGIYGPAFELVEVTAREPGSEEYQNSEKYEIRQHDLESPTSLRELISRVNRIRHENAALQSDRSLRFYTTDNDQLICYSKSTADQENVIVTVVNLDTYHRQSGMVQIDIGGLGLAADEEYQVHDLLTDARYWWRGDWNYVDLDPASIPGHILRVRRRLGTERDFDY